MVIDSWQRNWAKLSTYFKYPAGISKLIYTTNSMEGYHRQIRKETKNKGVFTSDMALIKLIYLATERIERKWNMPLGNWAVSASQLKIIFEERMKTILSIHRKKEVALALRMEPHRLIYYIYYTKIFF